MKKLLFVGLALCICFAACKKDKTPTTTPITAEQLIGSWVISSDPVVSINAQNFSETLENEIKNLFRKNDGYNYATGGSVVISREGSNDKNKTWSIDGNYLVYDGYIKFATDYKESVLTLVAQKPEIKIITEKYLGDNPAKVEEILEGPLTDDVKSSILANINGSVKLVMTKQP